MTPGTRLGSYEIIAPLGAGGMGEVYRAKDGKLGREVALKLLPAMFTADPERLARFRREAQVLAALNHPHIGAIYGFDEASGQQFLVLELVDGESLDKRIARGPIPVDEALGIAKQIAEALEAAHEKGIIHRDLKPANVAVTHDGNVKVLDFGLAKATEASRTAVELANSPTITSPAMMTGLGMMLGTAAYMSPEQAKGRPADKRSDIWAWGCVLYEMLTGKRAFEGDDVADTLAAVMRGEPDWPALPPTLPPPIATVLRRSLEKDRNRRISDISIATFLLAESTLTAAPTPAGTTVGLMRRVATITGVSLAVAAIAISTATWLALRTMPTVSRGVTRFRVSLPQDASLYVGTNPQPAIGLSPDGQQVVFGARIGSRAPQLYVRPFDQLEAAPIRGTDGGLVPFFSPDGQWLGFFTQSGRLTRVPITGGTPSGIVEGNPRGAAWLPDGSIVFGQVSGGLKRVTAPGGAATDLTTLDPKAEAFHAWPTTTPDGRAVLFTIQRAGAAGNGNAIAVLRLDTGERRILIEDATMPRVVASGHLVFVRANSLLAVPFDMQTMQVRGTASTVLDGVLARTSSGGAQVAVSSSGTVAYVAASELAGSRALVWVSRRGIVQPINAPRENYEVPRLSPDGTKALVAITGNGPTLRDVWVYDFARGTLSRITTEKDEAEAPIWTPDGKHIAYAVLRGGARQFVWRPTDGSAGEEVLASTDRHLHSGSWTPDGGTLVSVVANGLDAGTFWTVVPRPTPTVRLWQRSASQLQAPMLSPDGRWLAYASDETNKFEIYVQAFPGPGAKYQISIAGGTEPRWARTGRELFYRNGDAMMAVAVGSNGAALQIGAPTKLFEGQFATVGGTNLDTYYDVSSDGQRFLMIKANGPSGPGGIIVVQNWFEDLKGRVAPK